MGKDTLIGGKHNDIVVGGEGEDLLFGGSQKLPETGYPRSTHINEFDILIGFLDPDQPDMSEFEFTPTSDTFILGDPGVVHYTDYESTTPGDGDFAWIRDFQLGIDKLILAGEPAHYDLNAVTMSLGGSTRTGLEIRYKYLQEAPDLLAFIEDNEFQRSGQIIETWSNNQPGSESFEFLG